MSLVFGVLIVVAGVFGAVVVTGTRRYLQQVKNPRPGPLPIQTPYGQEKLP